MFYVFVLLCFYELIIQFLDHLHVLEGLRYQFGLNLIVLVHVEALFRQRVCTRLFT